MRRLILIVFIALIGSSSYAQVISNSPYSSFGLGELGGLDHAVYGGAGNSNITFIDSTNLNFYNPASYNSLAVGQPLFSLGMSSRLSNFTEGQNEYFSGIYSVQHFVMAFPFSKHFGLAFGLKPYSRTGYEFTTYSLVGTDSLRYNHNGKGGINETFVGFSTDLMRFENTRLSVGANAGYLFGASVNQRSSALVDGNLNSGGTEISSLRANSFHYSVGTYFSHNFSKSHSVLLSATFDPGQQLNATYSLGRYYAGNVDVPQSYDTLSQISDANGKISSVPTFAYGLRYTWNRPSSKDNKKRLNTELSLHASYTTEKWEDFNIPFDSTGTTYLNASKLSFGLQYIPEIDYIAGKSTSKYYERMRYRAGFYSNTLPYTSNNVQVKDFGTTFGIGLPIAIQNSVSSINLGFAIGSRGVADTQSLRERYYGINVGISIAPGGDRWFVKRKLN